MFLTSIEWGKLGDFFTVIIVEVFLTGIEWENWETF